MNLLRLPVSVGQILIPLRGRIRSVKVNPDSQHRYWQYLAYVYFSFPFQFMVWHLHDVRWGSAFGSSASRWKRILSGQFCIIMMAQSFALSSPSRRYITYPNCSVHMNYTVKALLDNETLSAIVFIATFSALCIHAAVMVSVHLPFTCSIKYLSSFTHDSFWQKWNQESFFSVYVCKYVTKDNYFFKP